MYKALIIDDESDARGVLVKMLELFCPQVSKTYEAADGKAALKQAQSWRPDIIFLDIRLKKENGLDLAQQLSPFCTNLIFVTAYDAYAVNAFRTSAVDYLLKPVDPEHLIEAVDKATRKYDSNSIPTISLTTKTGLIKLNQEQIDYVQGEGNYCTFFCVDGRSHLVSKNISYYESILNQVLFVRIHQSYLVRIQAVEQYLVSDGYHAILKSGQKLPISRRKKDGFLRALQG